MRLSGVIAIVVAINLGGGLQYGYQVSNVNPSQEVLQGFLNQSYYNHYHQKINTSLYDIIWSLVVSIFLAGGLISVIFSPIVAERWGRRPTLILGNIISILANIMMGVAKYADASDMLVIGKLIVGIGIGVVLTVQPVFVSECVPAQHRGLLGSITGAAIEVGVSIGLVIAQNTVLGTDRLWPFVFFVAVFPNVISVVALIPAMESPKFLLHKNRPITNVKRAVMFYHNCDSIQADVIIAEIQEEIFLTQTQIKPWKEIFVVPHIRLAIILGSVIGALTGFCGTSIFASYGTLYLKSLGFSDDMAQRITLGMNLTTVIGCLLAVYLVRRFGRRTIVIYGHVMLQIINIAILVAWSLYREYRWLAASYVATALGFLWLLIVGSGPLAIGWFITTEMVPQGARSAAQGIAVTLGGVGRFLAGFLFFPLYGAVEQYVLLFYIITSTLMIAFVAWKLPETKNKSVDEVVELLKNQQTQCWPQKFLPSFLENDKKSYAVN